MEEHTLEKIFINKNMNLNERELAVIAALNEMYSSKHKYLYASISMIGYELTGKFLKTKNKRERNIISSIQRGIDSLVERNIIEIIDQDDMTMYWGCGKGILNKYLTELEELKIIYIYRHK